MIEVFKEVLGKLYEQLGPTEEVVTLSQILDCLIYEEQLKRCKDYYLN